MNKIDPYSSYESKSFKFFVLIFVGKSDLFLKNESRINDSVASMCAPFASNVGFDTLKKQSLLITSFNARVTNQFSNTHL